MDARRLKLIILVHVCQLATSWCFSSVSVNTVVSLDQFRWHIRCERQQVVSKRTTRLFSSSSPPQPSKQSYPKIIDPNSWPEKFPAKNHCSKCGLCETKYVTHVIDACAFLGEGMKRNIDGMEERVHGRRRNLNDFTSNNDENNTADEARFGVLNSPMVLARGKQIPNAQWTGCVTGIAVSMLEAGMVDAVVCIASSGDEGWSNPEPILARTVEEVMRGRGVKPALAPSLRVLEELERSTDVKRLLFCGVGCAVQGERL